MSDAVSSISLQSPAVSTEAQIQPLRVRNWALLAIMAAAPLAVLLALADHFILNARWQGLLMDNPHAIAYWASVLALPHILTSLMTFIDRRYIAHYRRPLAQGALVALTLGVALPLLFGPGTMIIALAFYTMYHNLEQSFGISLMMLRKRPSFDFMAWKRILLLACGIAYLILLGGKLPWVEEMRDPLIYGMIALFGIAAIFGVRFVRALRREGGYSKIGMAYFLSAGFELYACAALILTGYGVLAALVPRITHNLTAFLIYIVHDHNRNAAQTHNPVYALPKWLGLSPALACVPLSFALAYIIYITLGSVYVLSLFIIALNFMHFYMEGYMWKRGTPHRDHVQFS